MKSLVLQKSIAVLLLIIFKRSDAPRSRREKNGVVETNRTILEWSENITKAIEDDKARGDFFALG